MDDALSSQSLDVIIYNMSMYYLVVLLILLLFVACVLLLAQTINYKRERGKRIRDLSDKEVFKKKRALLNTSEATLLRMLRAKLGENTIVMPQVNLLTFIEVDNSFENLYEEIETLRKFTVDYLIIDSSTTEPRLVIELDGKSHEGFSKKNRDHYVNKVCAKVNLPIVHIQVGDSFESSIKSVFEKLE